MSSWLILAYGLILFGCLLAASELTLPAHGVLAMLGLSSVIVGAALTFRYDLTLGLATAVGLLVVGPFAGRVLLGWWPHSPMGRRLMLQAPGDARTVAESPAIAELERLRGRFGKALSPLRPAGTVDFDGRRVDTVSDSEFVEAGQWVRCVDVQANRVVVRPASPPTDGLETMNLG